MDKLEKSENYTNETFEGVIQRAKKTCENSNINGSDHFVGADKMVQIGSGAKRI